MNAFTVDISKSAQRDLKTLRNANTLQQVERAMEALRTNLQHGEARRLLKPKGLWVSSVDHGRNAHRIVWARVKKVVTVYRVMGHDEYERIYH